MILIYQWSITSSFLVSFYSGVLKTHQPVKIGSKCNSENKYFQEISGNIQYLQSCFFLCAQAHKVSFKNQVPNSLHLIFAFHFLLTLGRKT